MNTNLVEVSIIVPCYNQAQYLRETIQSIINQSFKKWECLIVDDGSIDETEKIVLEYVKLDNRIKYFKKDNEGVSVARNYGISRALGEYILPVDGDDCIAEKYIELSLNEIKKDKNIKVVYCNANFFGAKEGSFELPKFDLSRLARENLIFCSALYKKADWERIGGYDYRMKNGLEDWEFWINLLKGGGKVVRLEYDGFFYRIRDISRNNSLDDMQILTLQNYVCIKHADFVVKHIGNPIYLEKKMRMYKSSLEYISNKLPYKFFKWLKPVFGLR